MKIIPTILTTGLDEWVEQMKLFPKYFNRIQLDIADGTLAPNTTIQIDEMVVYLSTHGAPFTGNVTFDFHLMVHDYQRALASIKRFSEYLKVNTILINASLSPNIVELKNSYPSFSIGIDIDDRTSIDEVLNNFDLKLISELQVMTVAQGFQGGAFLPESLNKIHELRKSHYRGIIMIDGGVNDSTLETILSRENRPDMLCVGSYLTKAGDKLEERINYLNSIIAK